MPTGFSGRHTIQTRSSHATAMRTTAVSLLLFLLLHGVGMSATESEADSQLTQRMDVLENTLRAQESIRAIKRAQQAYSHFAASGLWSEMAALCTHHVVAEFYRNGQVTTVTGRASLAQHLMQQAGRNADGQKDGLARGQLNEHFAMQPIVTVNDDGSVIRATWHEFSMLGQFGQSASWAGGVYENEYMLENGNWKISRLRFYQQFAGNYDEWGHKAPAAWEIPYHFDAKHVGVTIPKALIEQPRRTVEGSAMTRLTAYTPRLRALADETQVRNLHNAFAYYMDRKRWDDVVDLFVDNGVYEVAASGGARGKATIRKALETHYGPAGLQRGELFDHINMSAVVSVSSDGLYANVRSNQLSMLGQTGRYAQWEVGVYENQFVKQQGAWKIKAIRYYPRLITNFDDGWQKSAQLVATVFGANTTRKSEFPVYPDIQYIGFSFFNPGSGKPVRTPRGAVIPISSTFPHPAEKFSLWGDLNMRLEQLEKQLDNEVAVDAVENLNSAYGYYIDESAWDNMADTFASTGSKEITGAGVYVGTERIRTVLNLRGPRGGRTGNFFTIHQLTQPVIHVAEDGLSANARMRLFQCGGNADGTSGSWIGGAYENTAIKENGEWKFGRQELYHNFNASYRNGWARIGKPVSQSAASSSSGMQNSRNVIGGGIQQGLGGAAGGPTIAAQFPPDHPIKVRQYAFPEIVEPPFHYANPVSGKSY